MAKPVVILVLVAAAAVLVAAETPKSIPEALREQTVMPPLNYHAVPHHITEAVAQDMFGDFMVKHAKSYSSEAERAHRLKVFTENLHFMAKHNKAAEQGKYTFTVGITPFADLTNQEFIDQYLMKNMTRDDEDVNQRPSSEYEPLPEAALPTFVDWRSKGCVGAVRNQGGCGSCWAFTAAALIEGAYAQKTGKLFDLSEQQIVDCDTVSYGCNGGWTDAALRSVINTGGITHEFFYPYCACSGNGRTCRFNRLLSVASISSYTTVTNGAVNEAAIQSAAAERCGVSVYIYASAPEFQHYTGGVFNLAGCPTGINHAVTVVGYVSAWPWPFNFLPPIWIVRNSWSAGWGAQGYVFMAMNKNMCGIGQYSFFANA